MTRENAAPELPRRTVRISHHAASVALYFPPLRAPEVPLTLALFGLACLGLSLLAGVALLPAGGSDAHGMLVIALMAAFVVPFPVFGVVFISLAAYMLANSLTVDVGPSAIGMTRRVFGVQVRHRELKTVEVERIEPQIAAKYQNLFGGEPYFRLVAGRKSHRKCDMVVAESLKGELLMSSIRDLIIRHSGVKIPQA